jgi:hypothetical protein
MSLDLSTGLLEAVRDNVLERAPRVRGVPRTYSLICGDTTPENRFRTELDLDSPLQPDGLPLDLVGQILDCNTGLVWKRCVEGFRWNGNACDPLVPATSLFSWRQALGISRQTNGASAEDFVSEPQAFGNSDWRVPNVKELQSLQRFGQDPNGPFLPFLDLGFLAPVDQFSYWSSTAAAVDPGSAYQVRFGEVDPDNAAPDEAKVLGVGTIPGSTGMVRLVRSLHP